MIKTGKKKARNLKMLLLCKCKREPNYPQKGLGGWA